METIAYAWGCGSPSLPLFRHYCAPSEVALRVAAAHGWDATRGGAWAIEMKLPARYELALLALTAEAGRDNAVEGFTVPKLESAGEESESGGPGTIGLHRLPETGKVSVSPSLHGDGLYPARPSEKTLNCLSDFNS